MNIDEEGLFASKTKNTETDIQRLLRHWQNERHSPEILQTQDVLLGRVLDQIRRQSEDASALRRDTELSEEDHYMTMLVQTEVERVKFVVRSYVRTRLMKIEQFAAHITGTPDIQSRLSQAELAHVRRFAELTVSQYRTAVLDHLPTSQQGLDDDVATMPSMITEPDDRQPVFIHALHDCGHIQLPNGTSHELVNHAIVLTQYGAIKHLVVRGEVELI